MNAIPDHEDKRPTVLEICLAAERVAGQGSVIGAQNIRSLWRIYPANKEARSELLVKGIRLRDAVLQVSNTNPFILRSETGEEKPATKLWIDNIPISVAESEIQHSLRKIGCEFRSSIRLEHERDADNKLTRFLTGRRFVYITVPTTPLDKFVKISTFSAKLYHKEQKLAAKSVFCSRCLRSDHHVSQCSGDIVCKLCKQPGHKRGDAACNMGDVQTADQQTEQHKQDLSKSDSSETNNKITEATSKKITGHSSDKSVSRSSRSRPLSRQSTLLSSLERSPRDRSATPKRRRSDSSPALDKGPESSPGGMRGRKVRRCLSLTTRPIICVDMLITTSAYLTDNDYDSGSTIVV